VWALTRDTPVEQIPSPIRFVNCFDWSLDFLFQRNDYVCDNTGFVWKCPALLDTLKCGDVTPSTSTLATHSFDATSTDYIGVKVTAPVVTDMLCYDFAQVTALTQVEPQDAYCNAGRVWLCLNTAQCASVEPQTDVAGDVWYLTRNSPVVRAPPSPIDPDVIPDCKKDKLLVDGVWTGNDWSDSATGYSIRNGRVCGDTDQTKRSLWSSSALNPVPEIDTVDPTNNQRNVQVVSSVFTQADWDHLFSAANPVYTYDNFMKAIAALPSVCGEQGTHGQAVTLSLEDICRKELATMFAHFAQETGAHDSTGASTNGVTEAWRQGLYLVEDPACAAGAPSAGSWACRHFQGGIWATAYPAPDASTTYHGRGAKQLSWNYNYGPFSRTMFDDQSVLLDAPQKVAEEGWLAIASAFWFYVTPQSPKPSMHDIVSGFWNPNAAELNANIRHGFGATINVVNGNYCGYDSVDDQNRKNYYEALINYFNVPVDPNDLNSCSTQTNNFPWNGSGVVPSYFTNSGISGQQCSLVSW